MHDDVLVPVQTPMRASLNRPQLLLGGERKLVLLAGVLCAVFVASTLRFWAFLLAAGLWGFFLSILSRMGKADPMLSQVYTRHLRYRDWYPAKSGLRVQGRKTKMGWR